MGVGGVGLHNGARACADSIYVERRRCTPRQLTRFGLCVSLVLAVCSGGWTARAQDPIWLPTPGSGDFRDGANWSTGSPPAINTTGIFNTSTITSLTFSTSQGNVGGLTFNPGADDFFFTIASGQLLQFAGTGITVNGGSATITNNGSLSFNINSTAGDATIINNDFMNVGSVAGIATAGNADITNNDFMRFVDDATAGNATITNEETVEFRELSTAGNATIINRDDLLFLSDSTADNATITNSATGVIEFVASSTGGSATITNDNFLSFNNASTAENAVITTNNGGTTFFFGTSNGGQAAFMTDAGGITDFSDSTGPLNNNELTAGSLAGGGTYFLGPNQVTVGGDDTSTEVSGVISDCGPTGNECDNSGATGGSLVKTGIGTFTLSGANTYTGPTTVNQGTLVVDGSIASPVTVNNGARLMGIGQVGGVEVADGGVYAPGNSIGTMTVNGAFTLGSNAVYEVEVNAAGQSDKVIVNGAVNLTGATLRVLAENGDYKPSTDYTIIENDGTDAVVGTFATVTSSLAFLTPTVFYNGGDGNDVVLNLARNETVFPDVARTRNQKAVAGALSKFPPNNALYLAVLTQTEDGARQAFDALSGEIHATVSGTLADDSRYVRAAVLGRLMQASHSGQALSAGGPQVAALDDQAYALGYGYDGKALVEPERAPLAFWAQGFGAWGAFSGDGNAATADRDLGGFVSGMDANIGGSWRAGLATGASFSNVDVDARYSSADVESYTLGGYLGGMAGSFALRGGGMWAWSDIDTSRAVVFPGFFEHQKASYDADTGQLFGEVAYPTQMGGVALEPFGGLAFVSIDTDSFRERGGALASLRGDADQDVGYSTLGLRAATTMMWGGMQVVPHVSAAWQRAFDGVTPDAALAFAGTGIGFTVYGVPLAEDSALIDAGLDLALGENTTAGVSYTGQFGDGVTDNGVKGRFTWLF